MFFVLGQDASLTRSVLIHRVSNSIRVQESAILFTLIFGLTMSLIFYFFEKKFLVLICLGAIILAINQLLSIISIAKKDFGIYNFSRILNQVFTFASTIILISLFALTIENRLFLIVFGCLIGIIVFNKYFKKFNFFNFLKKNNIAFKYSLFTGIFLLLFNISGVIRLRIDKILFLPSIDSILASNLAVASMLIIVISSLIDSFAKIYVYKIYESFDKKTKRISRDALIYSIVSGLMLMIISFILFSLPKNVFLTIFGENFENVGYYASILLIPYSLFPAYLYSVNHAIYLRKTSFLGFSSLISSLAWMLIFYILLTNEVSITYCYLSQIIIFLPNIIFSQFINWGYNEK